MYLRNLLLNLLLNVLGKDKLFWCRVLFWKKIILTALILTVLCLVVVAFVYIPKYLNDEQRSRDNSIACKQYREFLQTAENWSKIGDSTQATGVYNIALDLSRKGRCTRIH